MLLQAGQSVTFLDNFKSFDYTWFSRINGKWHNSFFDAFFPFTREAYFWTPLYLFLVLFVIVNFKKFGWLWTLFFILNVFISDYISSSIIKELVFHLRPCRDPVIAEHVRFLVKYCPGSSGFTSSHAVNHFAAAMFIFATLKQKINPGWLALIFFWAFIPSYAQVYVGVHFPTDIIGGIIVGTVVGYLVAYLFKRVVKRANVNLV
jgi:membrane-associated phospholipid phosphatase